MHQSDQTKKTAKKRLDELQRQSEEPIFTTSTIFPFTFFPNRINVYENRVDLIFKNFFLSETINSFQTEDIMTVKASTAWFFGSLKLELMYPDAPPQKVRFLSAEGALYARDLIIGIMVARSEGIDLTDIPNNQIENTLIELAHPESVTKPK